MLDLVVSDGIPLWNEPPLVERLRRNWVVGWLRDAPAVLLVHRDDGTSLVAYDGRLAWAVTSCLSAT